MGIINQVYTVIIKRFLQINLSLFVLSITFTANLSAQSIMNLVPEENTLTKNIRVENNASLEVPLKNQNWSDNNQENLSKDLNDNQNESLQCSNALISSTLLMPLSSNGLPTLPFSEQECLNTLPNGDLRCNDLADTAGLNLNLEFFMDTDVNGEVICGCKCAEPVIEPPVGPSDCAIDLANDLEGTDFSEYVITPDAHILIGLSDNPNADPSTGVGCENVDQNRCGDIEEYTDIELILVPVEFNGRIWCSCQCANDSCETDTNYQSAINYSEFGLGTNEDPYRIHTAKQLGSIAKDSSAFSQNFKQCRDISLENYYSLPDYPNFTIGSCLTPFSGTYDGRDYEISHFTYDSTDDAYINPWLDDGILDSAGILIRDNTNCVGLFGQIEAGKVMNVNLENTKIDLQYDGSWRFHIGQLAGLMTNNSRIFNSSTMGTIKILHGVYVGGMVGSMRSESYVENSESNFLLVSTNLSEYTENHLAGGFVGNMRDSSKIIKSKASGNIYFSGEAFFGIGGFAGSMNDESLIEWSQADIEISGGTILEPDYAQNIGGFVGSMYEQSNIKNSYSTNSINAVAVNVGGFFGGASDNASIENSYVKNQNIEGSWNVGGFGGALSSSSVVKNSFSISNEIYGALSTNYNFGGVSSAGNVSIVNFHYYKSSSQTCLENGTPCDDSIYGEAHANQNYFYDNSNNPLDTWIFGPTGWTLNSNGLPTID
ncbi:hypothetical protein N9N67_07825 [Bacteriovoracaceae bacterium]|nr:hypothetical protein [Bacteriovoracaceae bacterium]